MKCVLISMAEGGSEDKDNPFSYKSFLTYKKKDLECEVIHSVSDSNLHSSGLEKTDKSLVIEVPSPSKENPFSFKNFLKKSNSAINGNIQPGKNDLCSSPNRSKIQEWSKKQVYSNDKVFPEQCTEIGGKLPDFIQDHLSNNKVKYAKDSDFLPEVFDISPVLPVNNEDFTYNRSDSASLQNEEPINLYKNSEHKHLENELGLPSLQTISVNEGKEDLLINLPDFISDGILNADKEKCKELPFVETVDGNPSQNFTIKSSLAELETHTKIEQLQEENAKLVLQLNKALAKLDMKNERILHVEQQLKLLQKKEAEDTAALEKMVHQVEVNLQNTTERAVAAEMNAAKLKEEIKLLQAHAKKLQKENDTLKETNIGYIDITRQADCLGAQIQSAVTSAEVSLKSLLKGVEHVHLLSSLVSDLGKIQEEKN